MLYFVARHYKYSKPHIISWTSNQRSFSSGLVTVPNYEKLNDRKYKYEKESLQLKKNSSLCNLSVCPDKDSMPTYETPGACVIKPIMVI